MKVIRDFSYNQEHIKGNLSWFGSADCRTLDFNGDYSQALANLNGSFALIYEDTDSLYLSADVIRSIPLFYSVCRDQIYVSDSAEKIAINTGAALKEENVNEYLQTGYVTERETLYNGIYQMGGQRGNYLKGNRKGAYKAILPS